MSELTRLQRENSQLRQILEIARYMAFVNDVDLLLGQIIEAACEILDCDRASIFLYDADSDELYIRKARGLADVRLPADKGIIGQAAKERRVINVPDAYADSRFNPEVDKQTGYRTQHLLTLPMESISGDLIGVLQALNKKDGTFVREDEELAVALAAQAGVILHRAQLEEIEREKERMQHDLEIARSIQKETLPDHNPMLEGYEIAGWNQSADETGGDSYDFFPLEDGRLAVFLADATGHGIGAALIIAQCRSLLRAMFSVTQDLRTVMCGVNKLLAEDLSDDRFVTAFVGVLDPKAHRLEYVSAGQGPLLLITDGGSESRMANGLPFAVLSDFSYESTLSFEFEPGALLALLTDGFYEAAPEEGEQFGEKRVRQFMGQHVQLPLDQLTDKLHARIVEFAGGAKQADDLTAVFIRRNA